MEPTPEPDTGYKDDTRPENPNLEVTLTLLSSGDVNVNINKEAVTLGDVLHAFEVGKLNLMRMYFEHLDKEPDETV